MLKRTFAANPANPANYRGAPVATVTVAPSGGGATISRTARLTPSRDRSVQANPYRYKVQVKQGGSNDNFGDLATGKCTLTIRAPCSREGCPEGQADFGSGCVAVCPPGQVDAGSGCATPAADACPEGQADFGSGCEAVCPNGQVDAGSGCATPASDVCPTDEAKFGDSETCAAATPTADVCGNAEADFGAGCEPVCPNGQVDAGSGCATPDSTCSYANTTCAEGSICPGRTAVSAECADRSAFDENPCACTALQELAALSSDLRGKAPWSALAISSYCTVPEGDEGEEYNFYYDDDYTDMDLQVKCALVDGVKLPKEGEWRFPFTATEWRTAGKARD